MTTTTAAIATDRRANMMVLTRSFRETVVRHVQEDPAFRAALVEEAARNVLDGDIETALGQLRDVVNATMGFDALSAETGIPKTSLMRMLSDRGNPRAGNLATILRAIGQNVGVRISVHAEPVGEPAHVD
jgi:DNA-binding phage protein